jgi:hypothetical protein
VVLYLSSLAVVAVIVGVTVATFAFTSFFVASLVTHAAAVGEGAPGWWWWYVAALSAVVATPVSVVVESLLMFALWPCDLAEAPTGIRFLPDPGPSPGPPSGARVEPACGAADAGGITWVTGDRGEPGDV